jgi:conjugal transfer mating pair stabilization protein TraG
MNASLTEAQSYTREARRAEEIANRLENQASFFEGSSAAGNLNLSQAYREWGMGEIERNRDFYGNARFDDIAFQLSPEGQELQAKFIDSYANDIRDGVGDKLVLAPGAEISKPTVASERDVRAKYQAGSAASKSSVGSGSGANISDEVEQAERSGRERIDTIKGYLQGVTKNAKGASEDAADDVKEWK